MFSPQIAGAAARRQRFVAAYRAIAAALETLRLSMRGLIRWHHVGSRKETRFEITSSGLTTVRALLTAAGATAADPTGPPGRSESRPARRLWRHPDGDEPHPAGSTIR